MSESTTIREHLHTDTHQLITVSGTPGCGATTIATKLAKELEYEYINAGAMFRELAKERDIPLEQLLSDAEEADNIDRSLDTRIQRIINQHDFTQNGLIIEARLAGWIAGPDAAFKIWLDAPQEIRIKRTENRTNEPPLEEREQREANRYQNHYNLDMYNTDIYDLVVNTGRWGADNTFGIITDALNRYNPTTDEGTFAGELTPEPLTAHQ